MIKQNREVEHDREALLMGSVLSLSDKGLPVRAAGMTVKEFLDTRPRMAECFTPLLTLDQETVHHNLRVLADWCSQRGFLLMPHGKTTMAPALWQAQLDAGAIGITLATAGQIRTAREMGFSSLLLANSLVGGSALRYIAGELDDPDLSFSCWADSVATVDAMEAALQGLELSRPINVCVELGAVGGRTGARTIEAAQEVARRIHAAPLLRLAGVSGYEGILAHDRSAAGISAVRAFLGDMLKLHESLAGLYDDGEVILTAGGSAFFDVVDEVFAPLSSPVPRTRYILRSGAYITHDDGVYRNISPLDATRGLDHGSALLPAMHGYAQVVSTPEPGLALIDAGKRDLPFDEGLPIPLSVAAGWADAQLPLAEASIVGMNDQHSYLRAEGLAVGSIVKVGISHPCTAFDKWRYIPMVRDGIIVDLIRTYF